MSDQLTVLSVAYPFAPVGPDAVGGAEQVLSAIDAGLVEAGHTSVVLACPGSRVRGVLHTSGGVPELMQRQSWGEGWIAHREAIVRLLETMRIDVVHMHGVDFHEYLPPVGVPTVVTLHLPLTWYEPRIRRLRDGALLFNCVSRAQRSRGGAEFADVPIVANGVAVPERRREKRGYAIALGRICREKGFHDAVDAARRANVPFALGGRVFPYPAHQAYFRDELAPRLDRHRRFLGPLAGERKRRLLGSAQCLIVSSLVEETFSLVALEALAAGTPVVARRTGALAEIIEPGRTGFLVDDVQQMADAIRACRALDPEVCRAAARERWPVQRMVDGYLGLYRQAVAARYQEPVTVTAGAAAQP